MNTIENNKSLRLSATIVGIIVTVIYVLVFGSKLFAELIDDSSTVLKEAVDAFIHPDEDPTAFIVTYLLGYILVWWRPLIGGIIIVLGGIAYYALADNPGATVFILPALLVGVLYIITWYSGHKRTAETKGDSSGE